MLSKVDYSHDEKHYDEDGPPDMMQELPSHITDKCSLDTFVGPISARWVIGTIRGRGPYFTLTNFRGDAIFLIEAGR